MLLLKPTPLIVFDSICDISTFAQLPENVRRISRPPCLLIPATLAGDIVIPRPSSAPRRK